MLCEDEPGGNARSETAKSLSECKVVSLHGLTLVGYHGVVSGPCESV